MMEIPFLVMDVTEYVITNIVDVSIMPVDGRVHLVV